MGGGGDRLVGGARGGAREGWWRKGIQIEYRNHELCPRHLNKKGRCSGRTGCGGGECGLGGVCAGDGGGGVGGQQVLYFGAGPVWGRGGGAPEGGG